MYMRNIMDILQKWSDIRNADIMPNWSDICNSADIQRLCEITEPTSLCKFQYFSNWRENLFNLKINVII